MMRFVVLRKALQQSLFKPSTPPQASLFHSDPSHGHVRQHMRRTKSGKLVPVKEHQVARHSPAAAPKPTEDHHEIPVSHDEAIEHAKAHMKANPGTTLPKLTEHVRERVAREHVARIHGHEEHHFDETDDKGKLTARAQRLQAMAKMRTGQVRGVRPEHLAHLAAKGPK